MDKQFNTAPIANDDTQLRELLDSEILLIAGGEVVGSGDRTP